MSLTLPTNIAAHLDSICEILDEIVCVVEATKESSDYADARIVHSLYMMGLYTHSISNDVQHIRDQATRYKDRYAEWRIE